MPLYEVTITAYVLAKDYAEARSFVLYGRLGRNLDFCDVEIYDTDTVDAKWMDVVPFHADEDNEDDQRTCRQIIEEETK